MAHYRIYFLNAEGRIHHARDAECEDDASALALARSVEQAHGAEVWQGKRVVGTIPAGGGDAS